MTQPDACERQLQHGSGGLGDRMQLLDRGHTPPQFHLYTLGFEGRVGGKQSGRSHSLECTSDCRDPSAVLVPEAGLEPALRCRKGMMFW